MNKRNLRHDPWGTVQTKAFWEGSVDGDSLTSVGQVQYDFNHSKATPHILNSLFSQQDVLYQKRRWDQVWPAKSPLECLFSWEYHSWLWQRPFPCNDFDDMMTETRDIVNDLSYGCVFVQTPPSQSAWRDIASYWQVSSSYIEGLAQASSIVKAIHH